MSATSACGKLFVELGGLADRWEAVKVLRNRVKEVGCLLVEQPKDNEKEEFLAEIVTRSVDNARYNHNALLPLMVMMRGEHDKIPELPALVTELEKFFKDNQRKPSRDLLMNQAWSIRYLFGIASAGSEAATSPGSSTVETPDASPKPAEACMAPPQKDLEMAKPIGSDAAVLPTEKEPKRVAPAAAAMTPAAVTPDRVFSLSVLKMHLEQQLEKRNRAAMEEALKRTGSPWDGENTLPSVGKMQEPPLAASSVPPSLEDKVEVLSDEEGCPGPAESKPDDHEGKDQILGASAQTSLEEELEKTMEIDNSGAELEQALAAEAESLPDKLPASDKDLRKEQLAFKSQAKEEAARKKQAQEEKKNAKVAAKAAAKAEKLRKKEEKNKEKQMKAEANGKKDADGAKAEGEISPSAEAAAAAAEVAMDARAEDEAEAADLEEVENQVKAERRKRRHKRKQSGDPVPRAKGRPRKPADELEPRAEPAAASAPKRARGGPRRGGNSTAVDRGLMAEIGAFMKDWAGKKYDKTQNTLHKGIPGMTPYWSRNAAGIKVPKQDGAGKWQACYFTVDVDKCCQMATNIFLSIKFQKKCAEEGAEWPESNGASEYYGLLVHGSAAALRRLFFAVSACPLGCFEFHEFFLEARSVMWCSCFSNICMVNVRFVTLAFAAAFQQADMASDTSGTSGPPPGGAADGHGVPPAEHWQHLAAPCMQTFVFLAFFGFQPTQLLCYCQAYMMEFMKGKGKGLPASVSTAAGPAASLPGPLPAGPLLDGKGKDDGSKGSGKDDGLRAPREIGKGNPEVGKGKEGVGDGKGKGKEGGKVDGSKHGRAKGMGAARPPEPTSPPPKGKGMGAARPKAKSMPTSPDSSAAAPAENSSGQWVQCWMWMPNPPPHGSSIPPYMPSDVASATPPGPSWGDEVVPRI
eukprot:s2_g10.t1